MAVSFYVLMESLTAAGIDHVALVAYGMKDVVALDMVGDVPYSPNGFVRRYDIGCSVPTK